jgi:hypothetical protein
MKNTIKFLGIIALIAVIGFSMLACGGDDDPFTPEDNTPKIYSINAVTWGNGKFVAVGGRWRGRIAYSTDGINWTAVADSKFGDSSIYAVAWGNGKFVAGGSAGKMAYSTDGINWTTVADSKFGDSYINAIAWGNGKFVASGWINKMAYSSDGISWTAVTDPPNNNVYIAWGNDKFVGVGYRLAHSTDGITWTTTNKNVLQARGESTYMGGITYGNNMFIAVGGEWNGVSWTGHILGRIAYSADGTTWTTIALPDTGDDDHIQSVAWGSDKWIIGGDYGRIKYSEDGKNWTEVNDTTFPTERVEIKEPTGSSFGPVSIRGIAWGNNKWVAVGTNGQIAYSADGITWTAVEDSPFIR